MSGGGGDGDVEMGPPEAALLAEGATALVLRDVRQWQQELVKAYSIQFACSLLWKKAKQIVDTGHEQSEVHSEELLVLIEVAKVPLDRIGVEYRTKFGFCQLWQKLGEFFEVTCALPKEQVRRLVVLNPKFLHVFLNSVPYRLHTRVPWGFLLSRSDSWLGAPAQDALMQERKVLLAVYSWNQWVSLLGVMYKLESSQAIGSDLQLVSQLNPRYSRQVDQDLLAARKLSPDFLAMVRSKGCLPDLLNRWWDKGAPDAYMTLGGPVVVPGPDEQLTVGDIVSCTTLVAAEDVAMDAFASWMVFHLARVRYMKNLALLFNVISDEGVPLSARSELSLEMMVPSAQFHNFADARNQRVYLHLLEKMLQLIKLMEDNQLSRVAIPVET